VGTGKRGDSGRKGCIDLAVLRLFDVDNFRQQIFIFSPKKNMRMNIKDGRQNKMTENGTE
jgi:hypothetical protein